jgi:cell wall-associated NlpC family hydrolase
MVNQLLFGEVFQVETIQGDWAYISSAHDDYKGWIDKKQLVGISEEEYQRMQDSSSVTTDIIQIAQNKSTGEYINLLMGSSVAPPDDNNDFEMAGREYHYEGDKDDLLSQPIPSQIPEIAGLFRAAPYIWGGRSMFGLDCSGFTQLVFKIAGFLIKRDAYQQAEQGADVDFISNAKAGDLAFFDNEEGKITHVGILLGDNNIIHVHGKVRIDRIDHQGIFDKDARHYSHKLRLIKRIVTSE